MPKHQYRIVEFPGTRGGRIKAVVRDAYERVLYALLLYPVIDMVATDADRVLMIGLALVCAVQLVMLAALRALDRLRFFIPVTLSVRPTAEEASDGQDDQIRTV